MIRNSQHEDYTRLSKFERLAMKFPTKKLLYVHLRDVGKYIMVLAQ